MRYCFHMMAILLCLLFLTPLASATSIFHGHITDLSPPYICKLKLIAARGVSIDPKHSYQFSGICSIKLPIGNSWIYQNVWVDTLADWNSDTNEGFEVTTLYNNMGTVTAQLKCDDDPWLTKGQCALVGYQNNTQFTNLGGVFSPRSGQYPPFEIITGQYPPLARNQALLRQAITLSIVAARQEAEAAHAAFDKTFPGSTVQEVKKAPERRMTKIFRKPRIGNFRVDCCLNLNKDCGKPAADQYCRSLGYRESVNCLVDNGKCAPTFIMGSQTVCSQPFCRGFEQVECEK